MAKKADAGNAVNLDSFLDIMTCLVGLLVLIIILTGIDAARIKVLINTPMEYATDKRPIFIECRNDELFLIPLEELTNLADKELKKIAQQGGNKPAEIYRRIKDASVEDQGYRLDLTYSLIGQTVLTPIAGTKGYPLIDFEKEGAEDWYGRILHNMNKEEQMITFIVRDDSFRVFKLARALAWMEHIDVSYELLTPNEPIRFGILGERPMAQ